MSLKRGCDENASAETTTLVEAFPGAHNGGNRHIFDAEFYNDHISHEELARRVVMAIELSFRGVPFTNAQFFDEYDRTCLGKPLMGHSRFSLD